MKKLKLLIVMAVLLLFATSIQTQAAPKYTVKVYRAGIVHVYKGKKLMRKMWCSCGLPKTPTPKGTFKTSDTYRWHPMEGGVYCQYVTRIYRGICFHSTLFKENKNRDSLIASSYNNLGHRASHGCIRLRVSDAKYIYNLAKSYRLKVIISDKKLSKPKRIGTIPEDSTRDPSDK